MLRARGGTARRCPEQNFRQPMLRISTEILYIVGYMGWPNSLQPMLRISTEILYYYHSWATAAAAAAATAAADGAGAMTAAAAMAML